MPRTGGVYSAPAGTKGIPDTTIASVPYNSFVDDLVQDANAARPITAGGTGATNATAARTNLGALGTADVQAAALKNPPIDGDGFVITDSANAGALKRVLWSVIKSVLKTYFDPIYVNATGDDMTGKLTITTSTGSPLLIENTSASINTSLEVKNTAGSSFFGRSGSSTYIGPTAALSTPPYLRLADNGQLDLGTSTGLILRLENYNASINTAMAYVNTTAIVYTGVSSTRFYISGSNTLTAAPFVSFGSDGQMYDVTQINLAGGGILSGSGNLIGSLWADWGSTTAKSAISARIEDRGAAYRTSAVSMAAAAVPANVAGMAVGTLGTYAFLRVTDEGTSLAPGATISGSGTQYANANGGVHTSSPSGSLRCMGYAISSSTGSNRTTLMLRYA